MPSFLFKKRTKPLPYVAVSFSCKNFVQRMTLLFCVLVVFLYWKTVYIFWWGDNVFLTFSPETVSVKLFATPMKFAEIVQNPLFYLRVRKYVESVMIIKLCKRAWQIFVSWKTREQHVLPYCALPFTFTFLKKNCFRKRKILHIT